MSDRDDGYAYFTLRIKNFRKIKDLVWSPEDACVLTGPNGSGKSTVFDSIRFLRTFFTRGEEAAFKVIEGPRAFHRWDSPPSEPVEFHLSVPSSTNPEDDVLWIVRFRMASKKDAPYIAEELWCGETQILSRENDSIIWTSEEAVTVHLRTLWTLQGGKVRHPRNNRPCAALYWEEYKPVTRYASSEASWMSRLVEFFEGVRFHGNYWMNQVRRTQHDQTQGDIFLHATGQNLWAVLENWQRNPIRHPDKFEWVMDWTRKAFPTMVENLVFDRGYPNFFRPGASQWEDALPANRIAESVLIFMLHLTAVAGAKDLALICFEKTENSLDPHVIETLVKAIKQRSNDHGLTVVMATQSNEIISLFDDKNEIYTMKDGIL